MIRRIFPGIVLLLMTLPVTLEAQRLSAVDTGKYSLLLPPYWKPGNKAWRILDDLLITKIPELFNKELCGDDCNPAYRVEFYMSNPRIDHYSATHVNSTRYTQTWNITTHYSFEAALLLFDHTNKLLTRILLIDPEEDWRKLNRVEWNSPRPVYPLSERNLQAVMVPPPGSPAGQEYLMLQQQQQMGTVAAPPQLSPRDYIYRNTEALFPTQQDLFAHTDDRIRSLRRE